MEIIIKGEPKEIAALELALKDGKANSTAILNQFIDRDCFKEAKKRMLERARGAKISESGKYKVEIK